MSRLENVLAAIDAYNKQDPNRQELPYSEKLTSWVVQLDPQPSEALRIAARGQHIGRWKSPRQSYPMDRGGYLRWREDLKRYHAKTIGELMATEGYSESEIEEVNQVVLKKNFQSNPDAQTIEDALCLVFLENQFEELRRKTPDPKMIDIIQKTWRKMSEKGKQAVLSMKLPEAHQQLIRQPLQ